MNLTFALFWQLAKLKSELEQQRLEAEKKQNAETEALLEKVSVRTVSDFCEILLELVCCSQTNTRLLDIEKEYNARSQRSNEVCVCVLDWCVVAPVMLSRCYLFHV